MIPYAPPESEVLMTNKKSSVLLLGVLFGLMACDDDYEDMMNARSMDGKTISANVDAALAADPKLQSFDIDVVTDDGVVKLQGKVDTDEQYAAAGQDAVAVSGVKAVANMLAIHHPVTLTQ
jgi:hypothetical protein